ncbi:DUF4190 domain-containing protein [Psychromicrobium lacuslunae]|uniref:DUF4190 domain-containing protein n=1 Tax=Psychromicrobium lacuslunae TaxID=1618207 RepID=UPI000698BAD4|nr:DUF4190 domain-containing protein [Psychromicrobium lacuslunae]
MSNQPDQPFQPPAQPFQPPPPGYPGGYGQQPPPGYPGAPQQSQGAFQGQNQQQVPAQPVYYSNPSYVIQPMVYADAGPKGLSIAGMILGIASIVGFAALIVPPIVGVILSHIGWSKEQPQGRGFALTGLILNYLAILIWVVFVVGGPLLVALVFGLASIGQN